MMYAFSSYVDGRPTAHQALESREWGAGKVDDFEDDQNYWSLRRCT